MTPLLLDAATSKLTRTPDLVATQSFRVEPPMGKPFVTMAPIEFTQEGSSDEVEPLDVFAREARRERTTTIVTDLVARARRAVAKYPLSARAHTNLGLALLKNGELTEAGEVLAEARNLDPGVYVATMGLATVRVLQGRLDEARAMYSELSTANPADAGPLMRLADIEARQGNLEGAIRLWSQAVTVQPEEAPARYHLALALLRTNDQARQRTAIKQLKIAARQEVRSAPVHHALGVAYALTGEPRRAIRAFRAALTLAPEMTEAVHGLAGILIENQAADEAIPLLSQHLERKPDDWAARELLGRASFVLADYKGARSQLHRALEQIRDAGTELVTDQARLANNLGASHWLAGNPHDAKQLFRRSIELKADGSPIPYHNLARLWLDEQQPRVAEELLRQCVQRFPHTSRTLLLLALSLEAQARYAEAIELLRSFVLSGDSSDVAFAVLGALLTDAQHDPEAAIDVLRKAQERYSHSLIVGNNLAYAHLMRGDAAEGRAVLEAIGASPANSDVTLTATWGLLHLWEGDIERGEVFYRKAEDLARSQGNGRLRHAVRQKRHLEVARAHLRRGDLKAAEQEVRKGLAAKAPGLYQQELRSLAATLAV